MGDFGSKIAGVGVIEQIMNYKNEWNAIILWNMDVTEDQ